MTEIKQLRKFMKANFDAWEGVQSDQEKKLPQPDLTKPMEGGVLVDLPDAKDVVLNDKSAYDLLVDRKSIRKYEDKKMTLMELSYLLYTTQGVKKIGKNNRYTFRTVPSGGARHAFVTYLYIRSVEGLGEGMYRYHPLTHQLEFIFMDEKLDEKISEATFGQSFVGKGAATFIWSCVPYRGEWRYHISAHKTMLLDAGHVCQNLYTACESIDYGTCAIAAYDQEAIDRLLKIDGEEEFVVYLAPVGKKIEG